MQRYLAFVLVVFPILFSMIGIKLIRDFFFLHLINPIPSLSLQLFYGIFSLIFGIFLIGNFIFYRDKKRNKGKSQFK